MSTDFPDDDPLAARLRDALSSEAAMVQPSDDGLSKIRSGVQSSGGRPWWRHPATPAAAAAVVLALMAGGIAIAFHGDNPDDGTVVAGQTTSSSGPETTSASTQPEVTDSAAPSGSGPPPVGEPRGVYVYYAHDDGQAVRLYREKHARSAASAEDVPRTALDEMMSGKPDDPDYRSLWAGITVAGYSASGGTATVDLSGWPKLGSEAESVAAQEVVYTVTANDDAVQQVRLLVDGKTPPSGHNDWSKPVPRAPMIDVQGWIWLLSPTQGQTVSSPVAINGYGTAFEGTISWEVTKDGAKVAEGHTQGGSNGEFGDFTDTATLDPGTYEIRAFESSAEDGSAIHVDTKTFTVR